MRVNQLLLTGIALQLILVGMLTLGNLREAIPQFLLLYFFAFLVYLAAARFIHRDANTMQNAVPLILGFAILFRFTLFFSEPSLSDDIYRYVWDGKVFNHDINPYLYSPSAPELSELGDSLSTQINHKDIGTPYGPVTIMVFAWTQAIANNIFIMKIPFIFFDCLAMLLLLSMLRTSGLPQNNVLLYAWNPLVLVEISGSGHNDSLAVLFLLGALFYFQRTKPWQGTLGISMALLSKYFAILFLPAIWKHINKGAWIILPLSLMLFFIPFYNGLENHALSLTTVGSQWRFNDSIFSAIYFLTGSLELSKGIVIVAFLMLAIFVYRRDLPILKGAMVLIGGTLLLTTTLQPWYLLWIIPFLCFYPNRAWILLTGLIMLSYHVLIQYAGNGVWEESMWIKIAIYAPFYVLLLNDGLRIWQARNTIGNSEMTL
jgi:hypothetical protein